MGRTSRRIPSGFLPPGTPRGGLVRSSSYAVSTVAQPLRATGRPWYAQPPMNQADLTALLKRLAPTDWPRIWSAIYGHREACVDAARPCVVLSDRGEAFRPTTQQCSPSSVASSTMAFARAFGAEGFLDRLGMPHCGHSRQGEIKWQAFPRVTSNLLSRGWRNGWQRKASP